MNFSNIHCMYLGLPAGREKKNLASLKTHSIISFYVDLFDIKRLIDFTDFDRGSTKHKPLKLAYSSKARHPPLGEEDQQLYTFCEQSPLRQSINFRLLPITLSLVSRWV